MVDDSGREKVILGVRIDEDDLEEIDGMVERGEFDSRSAAIRYATGRYVNLPGRFRSGDADSIDWLLRHYDFATSGRYGGSLLSEVEERMADDYDITSRDDGTFAIEGRLAYGGSVYRATAVHPELAPQNLHRKVAAIARNRAEEEFSWEIPA